MCTHLDTPGTHRWHHTQDRLPTPFGLVRSGVAPDHADTKVGLFWLLHGGLMLNSIARREAGCGEYMLFFAHPHRM